MVDLGQLASEMSESHMLFLSLCTIFQMRTADVAKLVSRAWKILGSTDRLVFLDLAKQDKERYEIEKANYKGPWKVIDVKDRSAPKRPMSAFLAFSNSRRKEVTEANPMLSNGEISKILSDMWRAAPLEQKQAYQDEEVKLRQQYKASVSKRNKVSKNRSSTPITEDGSITSSARNSMDDDDDSFDVFDVMLDSLEGSYYAEDNMSNSSRGQSISENTARVTLPDEADEPITSGSSGVDYMMLPAAQSASIASSLHIMEQPLLDSPYQLKPLIETDFGGFLAAAALLDGSSEPFCE